MTLWGPFGSPPEALSSSLREPPEGLWTPLKGLRGPLRRVFGEILGAQLLCFARSRGRWGTLRQVVIMHQSYTVFLVILVSHRPDMQFFFQTFSQLDEWHLHIDNKFSIRSLQPSHNIYEHKSETSHLISFTSRMQNNWTGPNGTKSRAAFSRCFRPSMLLLVLRRIHDHRNLLQHHPVTLKR